MKISAKGRYAVQMMIDITLHSTGSCITLKDVSRRQSISVKYLEQVVGSLTAAGYLKSERGPQGGYRLADHSERCTVGDILRAVEGSLEPVPLAEEGQAGEDAYTSAAIRKMWNGLFQAISQYLDGITLEDIARETLETTRDDYSI